MFQECFETNDYMASGLLFGVEQLQFDLRESAFTKGLVAHFSMQLIIELIELAKLMLFVDFYQQRFMLQLFPLQVQFNICKLQD